MITKEEAIQIAKEYINERKRSFLFIDEDTAWSEVTKVIYGKKDFEEQHNMWIVPYEVESWDDNVGHFVYIKAETGEVYYTMTPHGYVEDWEEDEEGNVLEESED